MEEEEDVCSECGGELDLMDSIRFFGICDVCNEQISQSEEKASVKISFRKRKWS